MVAIAHRNAGAHQPAALIDSLRAQGSDARGEVAVDAAITALRAADRLTAVALEVLDRLAPAGRIERAAGLPVELLLALEAHRPHAEARALAHAAGSLRSMPVAKGAFARGQLSWATLRAICAAVRAVDAAGRAAIDGIIAAALARDPGIEPDVLLGLVDDAIADLRQDLVKAREDRAVEGGFVSLQPRLDGQGGSLYAEADTETFASICEAIDIASPKPLSDDDGSSRARQRLDGLRAICESFVGGNTATRPRPRFLVSLDLRDLADDEHPAARVLWRARGGPGRLSQRAVQTLLCDAEMQPFIFDGGRPIAVGDVVNDPSPRARAALIARDGGCRFPGCTAPAGWSDVHHTRGRGPGRTRSIDDLVLLCRRCHRRVHRQRWKITVHADPSIAFEHRGHSYTSYPRIRGPARE